MSHSMKEPGLTQVLIIAAHAVPAPGLPASLWQYGYTVAGIAGDAEAAERLFKENDVDIILTDIHTPGARDGIDIVAELMKIKRVPVVYLMAVADAGAISRAKQTYPVSFLPKPCNGNDVCIAIELAIHNFRSCHAARDSTAKIIDMAESTIRRKKKDGVDKEIILRQGSSIFIKRNFQFVKVSLHEILYMEADGNYVHIVVKDKKFTIRLSLMQVIRMINYSGFAHINRSSVVNIDAIQSFNKEQVVIGQYEIAIGKNYKEAFFRQLGFQ